jgi:hypothetical protein
MKCCWLNRVMFLCRFFQLEQNQIEPTGKKLRREAPFSFISFD